MGLPRARGRGRVTVVRDDDGRLELAQVRAELAQRRRLVDLVEDREGALELCEADKTGVDGEVAGGAWLGRAGVGEGEGVGVGVGGGVGVGVGVGVPGLGVYSKSSMSSETTSRLMIRYPMPG